MDSADKLPLLKKALSLLTQQLRRQVRISIVVSAVAGMVVPPNSGTRKTKILGTLSRLDADGSTAGSAGGFGAPLPGPLFERLEGILFGPDRSRILVVSSETRVVH